MQTKNGIWAITVVFGAIWWYSVENTAVCVVKYSGIQGKYSSIRVKYSGILGVNIVIF